MTEIQALDLAGRLKSRMVAKGLLSKDQLRQAAQRAKETKESLGEAIANLGFVTEADLLAFVSGELEIPFLDPREYSPDSGVLELISEEVVRQYHVLPLFKTEDTLTLATADPMNVLALDELQLLAGCKIFPVLSKADHLAEAIEHYYGVWGTGSMEAAITSAVGIMSDGTTPPADDSDSLIRAAQAPPVVRLIDTLISDAVQAKATDIHIEPGREKVQVRYRIDGILGKTASVPKALAPAMVSCIKVITDLDITERRKPQDARMTKNIGRLECDIRVAIVPTIYGEKIVLRLLPSGSAVLTLAGLGLPGAVLRQLEHILKKPEGLLLLVGPTGSGKTTTLSACLQRIPRGEKNVVSIEDPVEYRVEGVNQMQIDLKAGFTFATALRAILRQDPDVILVGEMRDEETASLAVRAAITGHLVLSTLHTNDAASSVARLLDMQVEPYLLASALKGVLSQRLVRAICPKCKEVLPSGDVILEEYGLDPNDHSDLTLYRGAGCSSCGNTGYSGRIAIGEFMPVNSEIVGLIAAKSPSSVIEDAAKRAGLRPIRECGMDKVREGITTLDDVLRVTEDGKA